MYIQIGGVSIPFPSPYLLCFSKPTFQCSSTNPTSRIQKKSKCYTSSCRFTFLSYLSAVNLLADLSRQCSYSSELGRTDLYVQFYVKSGLPLLRSQCGCHTLKLSTSSLGDSGGKLASRFELAGSLLSLGTLYALQ